MTTPSERVRALHLGSELLVCIHADAAVDLQSRELAVALIDRFPNCQKWSVQTEVQTLPPSLAETEVIFEAGVLFESLAGVGRMGSETANLWRTVMRHYPGPKDGCRSPGQVWRLFRQDPFGRLT